MSRAKEPPLEQLMAAMQAVANARAAAEWTNGYRVGAAPRLPVAEDDRLYRQEQQQWDAVAVHEQRFKRLARRLLRPERA